MANTRNLRDATLAIVDGTDETPNSLTIPIQEGDLSWQESHPTMVLKNRGRIDSRKEGDEEPMEVSFSFLFEQYECASGANTGVSVHDALYQLGGADDWVSTDSCGPYVVDLVFTLANPCAEGDSEVLTFPKFHADKFDFKEGSDADKCTVSGKCLATMPTRAYDADGDIVAPIISAISSGTPDSDAATITWTTDEASDSAVEYGTTTAYGSTVSLTDPLVTSHTVEIAGLAAGTEYHYRVLSRDAAGNLATSADGTFTTDA